MASVETVRARLGAVGQGHVLRFWDELDAAARGTLLEQISRLDLEGLPGLIGHYVQGKAEPGERGEVAPAPYYGLDGTCCGRAWDRRAAATRGEAMIRAGKVAAFVVAGGQGSRLGFEGPKGCFPAGAVTGKPLFQIFADNLLGARDRYGVHVPWYIMTSPLNHGATEEFFRAHAFFGLEPGSVRFFMQGVMPSLEMRSGRLLLAGKGEVATNPDGHGGCVRALHESGALTEMKRRGVEQVSYFQVDNPHVRVLDPVFLGLHAGAADSSGEMSSKMVERAGPDEKVGVFCRVGGKLGVVEYSDMPVSLAGARREDGRLAYNAGSIAIHVMSVEFLGRLATDPAFSLEFHRAEKKVPFVDVESGRQVAPEKNNAVKLERFVFDALGLCRESIVVETDRVEEFAPIKNATGVDSVESSKALQTERAARWLRAAGVDVPTRPDGTADCVLEISARTATCADELRGASLPRKLERGERVAL
ncbi:MAG: UDPGP type 1 family protein [Phycisphaerales bacterium]|nr:UDPGP type 1 family protein [Phycisphaerales bacterium]